MTTLNRYITKLNSKQQDYIVYCVQTYGKYPDFHRGKLPFISACEAANCLKLRLEIIRGLAPPLVLLAPEKIKGERFINGILNVFADALPHKLYEDEATLEVMLKDQGLAKWFGKRFSKKFCVKSISLGSSQLPSDCLVELEWIRQDQWKVTTHANRLEEAIMLLTDLAR